MKINKILLSSLLLFIPIVSQSYTYTDRFMNEGEIVTMYGRITEIGEYSITVAPIVEDDLNTQKVVELDTTLSDHQLFLNTIEMLDLHQEKSDVRSNPNYRHLFQGNETETDVKRYIFTYKAINNKNILIAIDAIESEEPSLLFILGSHTELKIKTHFSVLERKDRILKSIINSVQSLKQRAMNYLTEEKRYKTKYILGNIVDVRYTQDKKVGVQCYVTVRYQNEYKQFTATTFEIHDDQYTMFHLARNTMFYGMVPVKITFCTDCTIEDDSNEGQPMVVETISPMPPENLKEYKEKKLQNIIMFEEPSISPLSYTEEFEPQTSLPIPSANDKNSIK